MLPWVRVWRAEWTLWACLARVPGKVVPTNFVIVDQFDNKKFATRLPPPPLLPPPLPPLLVSEPTAPPPAPLVTEADVTCCS
jgi:hypothetical protein